MRDRQDSTVAGRLAMLALVCAAAACKRDAAAVAPAGAGPARDPNLALLDGVVDPWQWPRARGANARARAIEDIGPYERPPGADAGTPPVNTNAHYWTALVGIAWDRDVDIDFDHQPVDLDGDGRPDTIVTRHVHAKGGVLANPELFGLTRTPADPRGRVGRVSASTGVMGLREALLPDGAPSGEIGMTCWLCHASANPVDGDIVLGLPATAFDYGLLLATAAVLDDGNADAARYRRARGFPDGRAVRARLLLAGPGRQDLTGEFGLDVTVPGTCSARYPGTARVRQGTRGLVNPISVPGILAAPGLAIENWSGSEDAAAPRLERLAALLRAPEAEAARRLGVAPDGGVAPADVGVVRRNLMFDLRNLGTLGLQQDSFPGLLWADAITDRVDLPPAAVRTIPKLYAAEDVRATLATTFARPAGDAGRIARGRQIFADRVAGTIINRQILTHVPAAYAAARIEAPVLAPIDPTKPLDAKLAVRCADCHAGAPLEAVRPLRDDPPPLGRCSHCHAAHPRVAGVAARDGVQPTSIDPDLIPVSALAIGRTAADELGLCEGCHHGHRAFGPLVYSSGRVLPFDADGDGDAQLDPDADRRAGGIGTDPWLAFDVPRDQWPFSIDVPAVTDAARAGHVTRARTGAAWVRAAPLLGLAASAPYLHNGSVPTLRALLDPAARRPTKFALGRAGFVLDTRLPGNGNQGHEFGTAFSAADKQDLIAFLESL